MEANIILNGKAYPLRPTFDLLCDIEKELGATITELTVKLTEGTMTLEELSFIVTKCADPEVSESYVRYVLLDNGFAHVTKAVAAMFAQIFSGIVTTRSIFLAMRRWELMMMSESFPD